MLLSYVQIANMALQHIGEEDRLEDPNDKTRAALAVRTAWDTTRLLVLADAHWSFAARTVQITARPASLELPTALGRTAFPLPIDMVNLCEIVEPELNDDDDEFAIEAGLAGQELLVADAGPITIRYIRECPETADPARWTPGFVEAFAFRLAWQISDTLGAKTSRKDRAERSYENALKKARKANARTKPFRRNPPTDFTRSRHGGREGYPQPMKVG